MVFLYSGPSVCLFVCLCPLWVVVKDIKWQLCSLWTSCLGIHDKCLRYQIWISLQITFLLIPPKKPGTILFNKHKQTDKISDYTKFTWQNDRFPEEILFLYDKLVTSNLCYLLVFKVIVSAVFLQSVLAGFQNEQTHLDNLCINKASQSLVFCCKNCIYNLPIGFHKTVSIELFLS